MAKAQRIKVLLVEESSVAKMLLVSILNADPAMTIIGTVKDGPEAIDFLETKQPDVILMDVERPEVEGFETTRRIMETRPVPIIICTGSCDSKTAMTTFRLMEAGAVACVEKPFAKEQKDFEAKAAHMLQTVKLMSEVKVVRRWAKARKDPAAPGTPQRGAGSIERIGIGASTGGPPVLQTILTAIPKDFPVPILIVQHIAPGFLAGLVEWLNQTTGLKVHIASYGAQPMPGHVYLAPDDYHMSIRGAGHIVLSKEDSEDNLRPSVSHLFRSLAAYGSSSVGVLLTGMGKDGARELKRMKDAGAATLVQDRETSIVHGMPGEAISLGAATYILPPERMAPALVALVNRQPFAQEMRRA